MIVSFPDSLMSISARGTFGFGRGYGGSQYGRARRGAAEGFSGIYQRKLTLQGWATSRMRFYRPTNPQTTLQQSWRAVFTAGWSAYNLLTTDEKRLLSTEARHYRITGPNLFMRRWLQSNRA